MFARAVFRLLDDNTRPMCARVAECTWLGRQTSTSDSRMVQYSANSNSPRSNNTAQALIISLTGRRQLSGRWMNFVTPVRVFSFVSSRFRGSSVVSCVRRSAPAVRCGFFLPFFARPTPDSRRLRRHGPHNSSVRFHLHRSVAQRAELSRRPPKIHCLWAPPAVAALRTDEIGAI